MCNFPGKLVAWLDHELPEHEAAEVQQHLRECKECRDRVNAYEQVGSAVNAYCDEALASKVPGGTTRWRLALTAAALVGIALLWVFPRARDPQTMARQPVSAAPAFDEATTIASPAIAFETQPAPEKPQNHQRNVHGHPAAPAAQDRARNWLSAEPAIQIAIPAEAMFPPGAVPEGINFIADLSIGPDGSAQRLRLQPRLVGLERRSTRP
jgi:anti-sigma factor RsiW